MHSLYADVDPASLEELTEHHWDDDGVSCTDGRPAIDVAAAVRRPLPKVVDRIDDAVRPIVDAGYSRNDKPGGTSPYLSHGKVVTPPQAPSARTTTETRTMVTRPDRPSLRSLSGERAERRAHQSERQEQRRAERRDRQGEHRGGAPSREA